MSQLAILIPVYNAAPYLRECLDSILQQSLQDFELWICNDCSTDESPAILKEYAASDVRIHLLKNDRNLHVSSTRNRLLHALPEHIRYVAFIDNDDVCLPRRLEIQLNYLESHPETAAVGSSLELIDERSRKIGFRPYPEHDAAIRAMAIRRNPLAQSSMMLRREVFTVTGDYDGTFSGCEDYDYWLRALLKFRFHNLPQPLTRYRISSTQFKSAQQRTTLRMTLAIQKKNLFRKEYYSTGALLYHGLLHLLQILPDSLIMALFKAGFYKKNSSSTIG